MREVRECETLVPRLVVDCFSAGNDAKVGEEDTNMWDGDYETRWGKLPPLEQYTGGQTLVAFETRWSLKF